MVSCENEMRFLFLQYCISFFQNTHLAFAVSREKTGQCCKITERTARGISNPASRQFRKVKILLHLHNMNIQTKMDGMVRFLYIAAFAVCMATPANMFAQGNDDPDAKYAVELLKPGAQAPDFSMKTPEGKTLKLSDFRGKYVVIDFWASWCPDCRKDIPEVQRMYRNFRAHGVEFVGVSFDTDKAKWTDALRKYGMEYPQVSELVKFHDTKISKDFGVKWIPSMFLVDKEGKVVLSTVLSYKMERKLTEMFAENKAVAGRKEKVVIGGSKGKLSAVIQVPELDANQKVPMTILMHGFGDNKNTPLLGLLADSLQARGIASIRFDFNGHGDSEGDFRDMTVPNEVEDAKMVYGHVRALPYVGSIALVGHSQGGVVAGMTAGELGGDKIKAVVLFAPAAVLRDDVIRGNTFGATYNPLDPPEYVQIGNRQLGGDYIRTAFPLQIYPVSAKYNGAACILHGNADRIVPYSYGERYHEIWPGSQLYVLEGYGHGFSQNAYRAVGIAATFLGNELGK